MPSANAFIIDPMTCHIRVRFRIPRKISRFRVRFKGPSSSWSRRFQNSEPDFRISEFQSRVSEFGA
eukprot:2062712-Rhodomonas_salina.1